MHLNEEYSESTAPRATIIPIVLTSDKTHLSHSGKRKAWPVLMTIGNIVERVRFSERLKTLRVIGFLPAHSG